jgi:hypothetical protein
VTEPETGFIADAPVVKLARTTLERAWFARECWKVMGMQAHTSANSRINDPSAPRLLDLLMLAGQRRRTPEVGGEELERRKQFRALTEPTIGRRTQRAAQGGARYLRRVLNRWRVAYAESASRRLLRLAGPRKSQPQADFDGKELT